MAVPLVLNPQYLPLKHTVLLIYLFVPKANTILLSNRGLAPSLSTVKKMVFLLSSTEQFSFVIGTVALAENFDYTVKETDKYYLLLTNCESVKVSVSIKYTLLNPGEEQLPVGGLFSFLIV